MNPSNAPSTSKQSQSCQMQLKFLNKATNNEKFSILLVGSSEYCHLMSECLYGLNKQTDNLSLSISKTESIENILKSSSLLHIDFVVFLMNTAQRHCIEQVERNICLVDSIYLSGKIVLVNGSNHLSPVDMGLSHDEIFNLTQKYRLHLLNGNILDEDNCYHLGKRILAFVSVVCGLTTGTPTMLDFPIDKFPLY